MIKTVIFDLGGVIVPLDFANGYATLESRCGIPGEQIAQKIGATGLLEPFESGDIEPEPFAREICSLLGLDLTFEEFCDVWSSIFPQRTIVPESLISALKKRYRVQLLSNTNSIHFPYILDHFPVMDRFDGYTVSYEVGAMKPAAKIYEAAAALAGCRPDECFFTDDVAENVEGARRAGMRSEHFESVEKLEKDFEANGIQF